MKNVGTRVVETSSGFVILTSSSNSLLLPLRSKKTLSCDVGVEGKDALVGDSSKESDKGDEELLMRTTEVFEDGMCLNENKCQTSNLFQNPSKLN